MTTPLDQERLVSKFVALLGTKATQKDSSVASSPVSADPNGTASRELLLCLSRNVEHHEVVCTLPSLDMRKLEEESDASPLPKVGQHRMKVPQMAASVLNVSNVADASAKAARVEQKAAQSLGTLTSWTKSSVMYAPRAVSKNVSDSFSSLVNSRVQAWTVLLLRHSLTTGDSSSRSRLLTMLSSIVKVMKAETSFKTLPLPTSAMGHVKEADVILPLLLEVEMQVSIQSKLESVTLRAPGTICGNLENNGSGPGLLNVDIRLDTGVMLDSMVQQARMVVFKAVAKATSGNESLQVDPAGKKTDQGLSPSLSGFSTALNISSSTSEGAQKPENKIQLQKSRASALKLSRVLQGNSNPNLLQADLRNASMNPELDMSKKAKSVQFDNQFMDVRQKAKIPTNPSPKRQRVADTPTARLRSFKSFGRPHGGDFGSGPRNATFATFGSGPTWTREGKLANHPTPMQPDYEQSQDPVGPTSFDKKNATFTQKPSIHSSSRLDTGTGNNESGAQLPRTATAGEELLLKSLNFS